MSAIFVKIPPAIRRAAAPSDSPMANPMKHGPANSPGMKSRMQSIRKSSTLIRSMPMLMPDSSGIDETGKGRPWRLAKAVREFASVLIRIPNQATP